MRIGVAGVMVALAPCVLGAAGPAAAAASTTAKLTYTCGFGSGETTVGVSITATFPDRVTTGKPFQPTGVRTAVTIPHEALASLGDATSVSATTQLTVKVAQGTQSADADWAGDAPTATIPPNGPLDLTATGDVPTVTVHGDEPVTFTAAALDLTIAAGGTGKPSSVSCRPSAGQRTLIARLLTNGAVSPSATPSASPSAPSATPSTTGSPSGSLPPATPGSALPGTRSTKSAPDEDLDTGYDPDVAKTCRDGQYLGNPQPASAYVSGLANVRKLNAAAVVGYPEPALLKTGTGESLLAGGFIPEINGLRYNCSRFTASLDHHGRREFPVSTSTSSAFGFVPVTATAHISQLGNDPVSAVAWENFGPPGELIARVIPWYVVSTAKMSLRLSDVRVNGVPLDVGPNCRTNGPLYTPDSPLAPGHDEVALTGGTSVDATSPVFGTLTAGGGVGGDVTIPPFTGCVTPNGDSLNDLLTASVSGSGNHTKLTTTPFCTPNARSGCAGDVANLEPRTFASWTLTHGGPIDVATSASNPLTFHFLTPALSSPPHTDTFISCPHARMAGIVYDHSGPARGPIGDLQFSGLEGCTDDRGATWTINEERPIAIYPVQTPSAGASVTNVRGTAAFKLTRTGGGQLCSVTIENAVGFRYDNSTGLAQFTTASLLGAGADMLAKTSSCTEYPALVLNGQTVVFTQGFISSGDFTIPADQAFTLTNP